MKAPKIINYCTICIFAFMLQACESHEQKPDDAFENEKNALGNPLDSNAFIKENSISKKIETAEVPKTKAAKTILIAENNSAKTEWTIFRNKTEKQLNANENTINEIKGTASMSFKQRRKMKRCEAKNLELKRKLEEFTDLQKLELEDFKTKLSSEAFAVDSDLKSIQIENKKN